MNIRAFAVSLALGPLLAAPQLSLAADNPPQKATARDISTKAMETGRAIKDYTLAERDQAVKQAKAGLDEADARIRRAERQAERDWDRMDQAGRKKTREALDALHRERNEAAEWYGGLKHSSAESWEQVKAGFTKSYEALKESFAKGPKSL